MGSSSRDGAGCDEARGQARANHGSVTIRGMGFSHQDGGPLRGGGAGRAHRLGRITTWTAGRKAGVTINGVSLTGCSRCSHAPSCVTKWPSTSRSSAEIAAAATWLTSIAGGIASGPAVPWSIPAMPA